MTRPIPVSDKGRQFLFLYPECMSGIQVCCGMPSSCSWQRYKTHGGITTTIIVSENMRLRDIY